MVRHPDDVFLGLGDKTGTMNLHGRRLRVAMKDALGYSPLSGDPLYKHWPFLITRDANTKCCYGIMYDNMAEASFDLGCEHSNYYGAYRTYEAKGGDLDMYFILGPSLAEVVSRQVQLTGVTALPPRWSLGFHCTAMPLADAPDAQARMEAFIKERQKAAVPASAFHFGSGYTSIGKQRYVFHWNHEKFPDPEGLIAGLHAAGMRVVANVKPCLLVNHPGYASLAQAGGFVSIGAGREGGGTPPGTPAVSQFWDGEGAHVDFTNPVAVAWWKRSLKSSLLELGVDAAWNDNNEYEVAEEGAVSCNFGHGTVPLSLSRPLHSLLMTRASFEQQLECSPGERPYSVTRAGYFGIQRYAQTWTGDNSTSWDSLRWNLRMGLTLSVSGMFNIGHDVGGFSGPAPDPELLVRWVQAGVLHPRFIMNSWKGDGTVTTPWMHPAALPATRWAIRLRYRLVPLLYSLLVESSLRHAPVIRPTFFEFPRDERCWQHSDELLLGGFLLAAPVVEPGARQRQLYLPECPQGWFNFYSEEFYAGGGREVAVAAPLERMPLFARGGAVVPLTRSTTDFAKLHDEPSRVLRVFPPPGVSSSSFSLYEDDGLTLDGPRRELSIRMDTSGETVWVRASVEGSGQLPYDAVGVCLPAAETRELRLEVVAPSGPDGGVPPLKLERQQFVWHGL